MSNRQAHQPLLQILVFAARGISAIMDHRAKSKENNTYEEDLLIQTGKLLACCDTFDGYDPENEFLVQILDGLQVAKGFIDEVKEELTDVIGEGIKKRIDATIEEYNNRLAAARIDLRENDELVIETLSTVSDPLRVLRVHSNNDDGYLLLNVATIIGPDGDCRPLTVTADMKRVDKYPDGGIRVVPVTTPRPVATKPVETQS